MLSDAQASLLKRAVDEYAPTLEALLVGDVLSLHLDQRNQLRSTLGDLLSAVGFDKDWEPTPFGIEIKHLIDVLGPKPSDE